MAHKGLLSLLNNCPVWSALYVNTETPNISTSTNIFQRTIFIRFHSPHIIVSSHFL